MHADNPVARGEPSRWLLFRGCQTQDFVPETRREVAIAAVLLAFAQECAPAQDACGRPLGCVIDAGPFNGAGLGAEAGEGADVEPRSG